MAKSEYLKCSLLTHRSSSAELKVRKVSGIFEVFQFVNDSLPPVHSVIKTQNKITNLKHWRTHLSMSAIELVLLSIFDVIKTNIQYKDTFFA